LFWNKKGQGIGVGRGARNLGFYVFLGSLIYTFFIFIAPESLYFRIILNIIAVILFFTLMRGQAMNRTVMGLLLVVLFVEVFLPTIFSYSYFLRTLTIGSVHIGQWYLNYSWALMGWFYFALYLTRDRGGVFLLLRIFVVLFWVFVFINFIMTYLGYFEGMQTGVTLFDQSKAAKNTVLSSMEGFKGLFSGAWEGFVHGIDNMIVNQRAVFTDAYYVGVVEENEGEKLGVYLEDLTPAQGEFAYDEDIIVYGKVKTRTLDDEVNINLACYAEDDEDVDMEGDIYPPTTFTIFDLQEEEIDCTIDPQDKRLDLGTTRVIFKVSFNFETIGYLKRYFTDRENLASATREGIDLLDQYEITDKNPQAKYTQGPVRLGIGPEQPLIGISETYPVNPRLGITLDSNTDWRGKIEEIHELIISMPNSMELDSDTCNAKFIGFEIIDCVQSHKDYKSRVYNDCKDETDVDACITKSCNEEFEGYNAYQLDVSHNPHFYKDIEDFISLSCRVKINDFQKVLGGVPINAHYFRARARYTYSVTESSIVKLVEPEGGLPAETTMIYVNEEERISDIFREYYYNEPYPLRDYTNAYNVDPCVVMGIISSVSNNNPSELRTDLPKGISKGLMMLTDEEAENTALTIPTTVGDLYYGPTSIQLGTKRLQLIMASRPLVSNNDLVAEYLGGADAVAQSTNCATKKKYECSDDTEFAKVEVLVRLVNESIDECNDLKLVESCGEMKLEKTSPMFKQGTLVLSGVPGISAYDDYDLDITAGTFFSLVFEAYVPTGGSEMIYSFAGYYYADSAPTTEPILLFGENYKKEDIVANKWLFISNDYLEGNYLPFVRYKFSLDGTGEVTQVEYEVLENLVINSLTIFEIEDTDLREPTALIDDYIYVQYVDEWGTFLGIQRTQGWNPLGRKQMLVFSYNDNDEEKVEFYAAPWPMDVTCVDSNVEDDDTPGVFGIVSRNKERGQELVGLDYTSFQFDYDLFAQLKGRAETPVPTSSSSGGWWPWGGDDDDDDVEEIEVEISKECIGKLAPQSAALVAAANTHDIDVCYIMAILATESCGEECAESWAGAKGIAQFMPESASKTDPILCNAQEIDGAGTITKDYCDVANGGFDYRCDPVKAIAASAKYLKDEQTAFKNAADQKHWEELAFSAYNLGRGNVAVLLADAKMEFSEDDPDWNQVAHMVDSDYVTTAFPGLTAAEVETKIKEIREHPAKAMAYYEYCKEIVD
jgi:soluble lytic murein transglycosylase-like protein